MPGQGEVSFGEATGKRVVSETREQLDKRLSEESRAKHEAPLRAELAAAQTRIDSLTRRFAKSRAAAKGYAARLSRHEIELGKLEDFNRAGGEIVCEECGLDYNDHANHPVHEWITVLCDGRLVKL